MESYLQQLYILAIAYAPKVLLALLTLWVGLRVIHWIVRMVSRAMERRELDATIRPFLASLVDVGLKVMLLLSVAGMFGIETTSFIALFSALAFAVGLALQGSLGHFASGVLLLIFKPYKVGDLVKLGGGETGMVTEIGVFNTVLRTDDNKQVIIPNGVVTSNVITNISGQGEIRVDLSFGVDPSNDILKVKELLGSVIASCPTALQDRPIEVFVGETLIDRIVFVVRPWCSSDKYWDTYFYMQENVHLAFDREKIVSPINKVVVAQEK